MYKQTAIIVAFFTAINIYAITNNDQQLASLNSQIDRAAKAHDISEESEARLQRICFFYNADLNDSIDLQAPIDMDFDRNHQLWENYYMTWNHLTNSLIFRGKVNTGLRELQKMHDDAVKRNEHFGMGVAYYGMGNAYINMERYDDAERSYVKSLKQLNMVDSVPAIINDVYSYYCDVLKDQKKFDKMLGVIDQWRKAQQQILERQKKNAASTEEVNHVWTAYLHIASAQAYLGLNQLEEASHELNTVELNANDEEYIYLSLLYYRAQLYLQQGNYTKALQLNSARLRMSEGQSDVSSPVLIRRQRVEILKKLNMFEEATQVYEQMFRLKDSFNTRSMRDQINELNTLFGVDELAMQHKLSRSRYMTAAALAVGTLLALFMIYWYVTSRRLRRKNEELVIAHEQAQESSRMKTQFIQNMSHEVRTPLNILSGFSQILSLSNDNLTEEQRKEAGEKIVENTNRITKLIDHLLALAESDSRTIIESSELVSCNQLCRQAILQSGVAETINRKFEFATQIADNEQIKTNLEYVVRSLGRLLENAVKFSPEDSTIKLSCQWHGKLLLIAVENDIVNPIPVNEAEHIFEPFVQLDDFHEGVGVGLSVSRNVIRRLGGDIKLDTNYAQGARFELTLPR